MHSSRWLFVAITLSVVLACVHTPAPPSVGARPVGEGAASDAERWIERTLGRLTLRRKVGQMIVPWISGAYLAVESPEYDRLRAHVERDGIGGVVISIGPPLEVASKLNLLQELADVPLLVAADMEHGPGQRLQGGVALPWGLEMGGGARFPPVMALGATGDERLAYAMGRITAREARAVGVHLAFAPVADVNNNPANPIINTRSYGADPGAVARFVVSHLRGMQEHGLLASAKHFPGHGDTGTDSHINLPVITVDSTRADSVELVPFRAAIDAGVSTIMSAHIAFPALAGDSAPATLSPALLAGLLRRRLGFDGIIATDALDMGAVVSRYGAGDAVVRAVLAGADMLLMPTDVASAIDAVVEAVERGEIDEARIDRSVRRLLRAKAAAGLHRRRTVPLDSVPYVVGDSDHVALARRIARRSITVPRDRHSRLPFDTANTGRVLAVVYTDDMDPLAGRTFRRALAARFDSVGTPVVHAETPPATLDSLLALADSADQVVFAPFVEVRAWKGDAAIAEPVAAFVRALAARRSVVVVAFGNPYVLAQFPAVGTYMLAWSDEDVLQTAAVDALTGAAPVTGRLPVAIPPYHERGEGLRLDPVALRGGGA